MPQGDSCAIADAMVEMLKSPPTEDVIQKTRQNINEYMSPKAVANKHFKLYKRIK